MNDSKFQPQKNTIDDVGDLIAHVLGATAGTSEKAVASVILLLSTIPEYRGMVTATGDVMVSIVAAAVSLVVVKLMLREAPHIVRLPRGVVLPIRVFGVLYVVQLAAGLAFIVYAQNYIDVALIAISAVGAVCSERIASVIKSEQKEASAVDYTLEKQRIQLAELEAKSALRVEAATVKVRGAVQMPTLPPNVEPEPEAIIDKNAAESGRSKALSARQQAAHDRQNALYQHLISEFAGVPTVDLPKSTLARQFDVTATTIKRDLDALEQASRINGTTPKGK